MSHPAPGPGRRSSGRTPGSGLGIVVVLVVLLPLLTAGALALVRPQSATRTARPPSLVDLSTASLVCPPALPGGSGLSLSTAAGKAKDAGDASGRLTLRAGSMFRRAKVTSGEVSAPRPGPGAVVVSGQGDLAPGLVAARTSSAPLAAVDCPAPAADQWFTALGAGTTHSSVVELTNPNPGPALADLTVYAQGGPLDVPRLRGVAIPGYSTRRLDLAAIVPRRGDLAVRVSTARGRLGVSVRDTFDETGGGGATDWLAGQPAPQRSNLLLGLPSGDGTRSLVLGNPGADEVTAEVELVSKDSVFAPQGVDTIRIPPQSTTRVTLTDVLSSAVGDGALGLRVVGSDVLTATLRSLVGGDLSLTTPGRALAAPTSAVLPKGRKQVLLGGATRAGTVTVVGRAADGTRLAVERVDLTTDRGASVSVPDRAVLVSVEPAGTGAASSVLVTGTGASVVALRDLTLSGEVPDVRPGLP